MRSFRNNYTNLRDTRIAYIFILSFSFICAVMGMIITHQENLIYVHELEASYESLTLCADALGEWRSAEDDTAKYSAAIRFENAAVRLPSEVEAAPLLMLAEKMRVGECDTSAVSVLADTFMLLSSIDYTDAEEAKEVISSTLNGVNSELGLIQTEPAMRSLPDSESIPPEVVQYTRGIVKRSIRSLFGKNAHTLEVVLSETGDLWLAENDNLRMSFSASDGSLEEFVYVRLGDYSGKKLTVDERIECAKRFFTDMRRISSDVTAEIGGEMSEFLLVKLENGEEEWQASVDEYGRIWTLTKVKR